MNTQSLAVESELVSVARALFEPRAYPTVAHLVRRAVAVPERVGRSTLAAVRDALAKGLVQSLARGGAPHRVWEREMPRLHLSASTFRLLHWVVAAPLGTPSPPPPPPIDEELTLGDELTRLRIADLLSASAVSHRIPKTSLSWLATPDPFGVPPEREELTRWTSEDGMTFLLALSTELARRWEDAERWKASCHDAEPLRAFGSAQGAVLEAFVAEAVARDRIEATRFLLELLGLLIPSSETPFAARGFPVGRALDAQQALGARVAARRAALAPFVAIARVAAVRDRLRLVGFVDDGYERAQAILTFLEPFDDGRFSRAAEVVRLTEQLDLEHP